MQDFSGERALPFERRFWSCETNHIYIQRDFKNFTVTNVCWKFVGRIEKQARIKAFSKYYSKKISLWLFCVMTTWKLMSMIIPLYD